MKSQGIYRAKVKIVDISQELSSLGFPKPQKNDPNNLRKSLVLPGNKSFNGK
jgi:hypothetical protein